MWMMLGGWTNRLRRNAKNAVISVFRIRLCNFEVQMKEQRYSIRCVLTFSHTGCAEGAREGRADLIGLGWGLAVYELWGSDKAE